MKSNPDQETDTVAKTVRKAAATAGAALAFAGAAQSAWSHACETEQEFAACKISLPHPDDLGETEPSTALPLQTTMASSSNSHVPPTPNTPSWLFEDTSSETHRIVQENLRRQRNLNAALLLFAQDEIVPVTHVNSYSYLR